MNPQAGALWTRGLLLCWILLLFVKQSCSNSSLGGDCINLLLLGECLFKIQIAANHHPPRFLLMPLKLSVKPGDDLHLRNFLNIYYCSVLCLRWGGRSVAGCVRGEHRVAQAGGRFGPCYAVDLLGKCPFLFRYWQRCFRQPCMCVSSITPWPGTRLVTSFEGILMEPVWPVLVQLWPVLRAWKEKFQQDFGIWHCV